MMAKKSSKCGKNGLFEHSLFLFFYFTPEILLVLSQGFVLSVAI